MDVSFANDNEVRLTLYREFVRTGHAPTIASIAKTMKIPVEQIRAAMERLASGKAIVLQPESRELMMAAPLCALPTSFVVHAGTQSFYGACIWDALGIIAMLQRDAELETSCPCCGEAMALETRDGRILLAPGIVHFGTPARKWWENIIFS